MLDALFNLLEAFNTTQVELLGEFSGKVGESADIVVPHGNVTASLVSNVNNVTLFYETDHSATHADDVIVRVRAENQDALGEDLVLDVRIDFGVDVLVVLQHVVSGNTCGRASELELGELLTGVNELLARLASRPASDSGLQVAEHFDVQLVHGTVLVQQRGQVGFNVVVLSQLQERFVRVEREPNNGTAHGALIEVQLVVAAVADQQPRRLDAGQLSGGGHVQHHL